MSSELKFIISMSIIIVIFIGCMAFLDSEHKMLKLKLDHQCKMVKTLEDE